MTDGNTQKMHIFVETFDQIAFPDSAGTGAVCCEMPSSGGKRNATPRFIGGNQNVADRFGVLPGNDCQNCKLTICS
ncbi:hypothetical protein AA103581_0202 [Gluconobacter wancherniae NBRC 103581]|nr:hypothetical protein AA103581_0202 [Gluconobacter wancherniae NBRC 103581]